MEKLSIIKIGGNVIDNPDKLSEFLILFRKLSHSKILIHGGGKIATRMAEKLGIETKMIDGRRITDSDMRDVVIMVYGGLVNKNIVGQLQINGCNAIGLSGADGATVIAQKRPVDKIDYGWVGDIDKINREGIKSLILSGFTPVFAPLSFSKKDGLLNTNADTMASSIAIALSNHFDVDLIYCFEKKGVLRDADDNNSVIHSLNYDQFIELKEAGVVNKGMIPKLENAFSALKTGVKKVIICEAGDLTDAANHKAGSILNL